MAMIKECECCNALIQIEDDDPAIILKPFPRVDCPCCGWWIPLFDEDADKGVAY